MPRRTPSTILPMLLTILLAGVISCAGPKRADEEQSTRSDPAQHIIALMNNTPITFAQIQDDLSERAGKQALLDYLLDARLAETLKARHLQISPDDIERENALFVRTISEIDSSASSADLLDSIRSTRGLGPERFPRLIRRNAILRKLVGVERAPSESEYTLAEQIAFGPSYRVRLFVGEHQSDAIKLAERVRSSAVEHQRWIFADACTDQSIHPSASRGGLIPQLSPDDPGYPHSLRDAIRSLAPDELSGVISTSSGFALVLVESITPQPTPTPDQIQSVHEQLALRKQRLEMQRLADEQIADIQITVLDQSLNWAWNRSE